jgi:MFS family permease
LKLFQEKWKRKVLHGKYAIVLKKSLILSLIVSTNLRTFVFTGSLVFNPINAWLVSKYGWRVGFRATSVLVFITGMSCCTSFASKRTREELAAFEKAAGKITISCGGAKELRARPEILLWLFGNTLGYIGFYMPFLNLVRKCTCRYLLLQSAESSNLLLPSLSIRYNFYDLNDL